MENRNEAEFVDIPQFFMRIIYRELVIVLRQISSFAAHHIECAQLGWAICHPLLILPK
jgi:hypothetical protein